MNIHKKVLKGNPKNISLIAFAFIFFQFAFCFAETASSSNNQESLTELQLQARAYREEGINAQNIGDIDNAMMLYQKALELDANYAVPYNDLGIIYESKGMLDRAEASYLKALKIDPYYLSIYTNLALFYENKRDFSKAAYCWNKRVELGYPDDPWTQKAKQRLEDIRLSVATRPMADARERDVVGLMKDVANEKYILRHSNKALANKYYKDARNSYIKEDYATSFKKGLDALYLDPDNKDIAEIVETSQSRALSK